MQKKIDFFKILKCTGTLNPKRQRLFNFSRSFFAIIFLFFVNFGNSDEAQKTRALT